MSSVANQYIIGLIICFIVTPGAICARDNLSDEDKRRHVERKCREQNLPYFKVADKHYCCGCTASQYVNGDCLEDHQNTTICKICPYSTYTDEPNTRRQCNNVSLSPDDCAKIMNSHYIPGNAMKPPRCGCNSDSFRYVIDSEKFHCVKHSPCPPNWYASKKGTATEPYDCSPCPVGECTNGYSFNVTCQSQPCTNASGLSDPTIPRNAIPTIMPPSTTPAHKSLENQDNPVSTIILYVAIGAIGIAIGVAIGVLLTCCYNRRHHRNSKRTSQTNNRGSSSQGEGEEDQLLGSSAVEHGSEEVDSPNGGDSAANVSSGYDTSIGDGDIPPTPSAQPQHVNTESPLQNAALNGRSESNQQHCVIDIDQPQNSAELVVNIPPESETIENETEQDAQTVGHVAGEPLVILDAIPHRTEDEPLKGCIRSVDPDEYEQKFQDKDFEKIYEPDVEANCIFAAVIKGKNPNTRDDSVAEAATTMRRETVKYMQEHKQQFRSFIPSSSSSNTIDDYLEKLKNPAQPCDEIVARVIALMENINIQIVHVDGMGQKYCGSQDQDQANDTIYIGHVEKNYYLLLKPTSENLHVDMNASSVRSSVSECRVDMKDQSVAFTAVTVDGPQTSSPPREVPPTVENRSCQSEQTVSNYTRPPERLREKEDWDLFDSTDQMKLKKNYLMKRPELDLSVHLDDIALAKAMLVGSPKLLPGENPLVNKETSTVHAFVRLPNLVNQPKVVISDAADIHKNDPVEKRRFLIDRVLEEQGESLSVRLLLTLSKSDATNVIIHRYFSDCFLKYLDTKILEPMVNSIPE